MEKRYSGMTVNERLHVADMINVFYKAIEIKDIDKVISILKEVELNDAAIKAILESSGLLRRRNKQI